jgi:hypothetical protein
MATHCRRGRALHGPRSDGREFGLRGRRAFFSVFGKRRVSRAGAIEIPSEAARRPAGSFGAVKIGIILVPRLRTPQDKFAWKPSPPPHSRYAHGRNFFASVFLSRARRGGTADFDLCFGRTEPETAGNRSYRRRTPCRPRARSW